MPSAPTAKSWKLSRALLNKTSNPTGVGWKSIIPSPPPKAVSWFMIRTSSPSRLALYLWLVPELLLLLIVTLPSLLSWSRPLSFSSRCWHSAWSPNSLVVYSWSRSWLVQCQHSQVIPRQGLSVWLMQKMDGNALEGTFLFPVLFKILAWQLTMSRYFGFMTVAAMFIPWACECRVFLFPLHFETLIVCHAIMNLRKPHRLGLYLCSGYSILLKSCFS